MGNYGSERVTTALNMPFGEINLLNKYAK
jgi:hypothetical protein